MGGKVYCKLRLAAGGGELSPTCVHAPGTVLQVYVLSDATLLILQAAAVSNTSAEHNTAPLAMQTHGGRTA